MSPNSTIAEGYEAVSLVLRDDKSYLGRIVSEDNHEVTLLTLTGDSMKLEKNNIKSRTTAKTSSMPSFANLLSIEEAADLVEFLINLKGSRNLR